MFDSQRLPVDESIPKEERRSSHRVPVRVEVFCRNNYVEGHLYWSAQIIDISQGGLQLLSRRKFEPTSLVRVRLTEESGISSEFLEAVVIRAQQLPEEEWTMGCALLRDLSEAELAYWLERNYINPVEGQKTGSVRTALVPLSDAH